MPRAEQSHSHHYQHITPTMNSRKRALSVNSADTEAQTKLKKARGNDLYTTSQVVTQEWDMEAVDFNDAAHEHR